MHLPATPSLLQALAKDQMKHGARDAPRKHKRQALEGMPAEPQVKPGLRSLAVMCTPSLYT